ncbi:MAG: homoserine dehydrogenase [Blautia sp.]|nr:homoserine dehydrogenase [Blautia sp.]
MIQTAVFGFGTVGGGVVDLIENNQKQIRRALPQGLHVKYILDIREFPDSPYKDRVVHDIDTILSDPEIKIVCETMGGKEPARTFTMKALERGISVCTSNKELVAAFGPELLAAARAHDCSYLFEASVGGGIPLIHPLLNCLAQEEISSVIGIMNGTTNYILTKMDTEGADYQTVLKEAQALGYAERNPEADVEGHDTGRKLSILSSLVTGKTVRYEDIYVEGISSITIDDLRYAKANGYAVRLLGISRRTDEGLSVMTAPFLLPVGHPLASVSGVFNGIMIHGNMVDDVMFYGRGAGKEPTGSAVVADMIHAAGSIGRTIPITWETQEEKLQDFLTHKTRFMIRVAAAAEAAVRQSFKGKISDSWKLEDLPEECALITQSITEAEYQECAAKAGTILGRIRILD